MGPLNKPRSWEDHPPKDVPISIQENTGAVKQTAGADTADPNSPEDVQLPVENAEVMDCEEPVEPAGSVTTFTGHVIYPLPSPGFFLVTTAKCFLFMA